ncbi:hypothetical protein SAMD00079811_54730 [Scytonema sp. HK-05]|uniref:hypothetical protein n=1 Tax=Scytonema sp. HK-05 TaxID=1137095 RepID=UPI000937E2F4|nr:hypothetical protein [Scytonema sp. HK-05]BAY47854.1 hypothetical protein SAMD00079811_54730 [Scytonema sp. HK-05]
MTPICNNECEHDNCPFRSDPYNPNRQVCVKCGQDYFFRRNGFSNFFVIAALVVCLLLVMKVVSNHRQTIDSQQQMQTPVQSTK